MTGFHSSKKIVVFLTQRYMERVNDVENNVAKQFQYALDFPIRKHFIIAILERHLLDVENWFGPVVEHNLKKATLIDFSSAAKISENFNEFIRELTMI